MNTKEVKPAPKPKRAAPLAHTPAELAAQRDRLKAAAEKRFADNATRKLGE